MSSDLALIPTERSEVSLELLGPDPKQRLAVAMQVASLIAPIIRDRGLASNIQGKEYVRFEGWTLAGSLIGVFPVTEWARPIDSADAGFHARVVARTLTGHTVGAAEAICTRDEKNWHGRDDFALMSMAQTRAGAKALRMPLGFVMQLAGYEATPAEEMQEEAPRRDPAFERAAGGRTATEKQRKLIWAKAKAKGDNLGIDDAEVEARLRRYLADLGYTSSKELPGAQVDRVLAVIETWSLPEPPDELESGDAARGPF